MNLEPFDRFFLIALAVCLVMAFFNAFRYRTRGARAFVMSMAFVALGVEIQLLRTGATSIPLMLVGSVVFCCLVVDMALRSIQRQSGKDGHA